MAGRLDRLGCQEKPRSVAELSQAQLQLRWLSESASKEWVSVPVSRRLWNRCCFSTTHLPYLIVLNTNDLWSATVPYNYNSHLHLCPSKIAGSHCYRRSCSSLFQCIYQDRFKHILYLKKKISPSCLILFMFCQLSN